MFPIIPYHFDDVIVSRKAAKLAKKKYIKIALRLGVFA
jgi:hypothetical protein